MRPPVRKRKKRQNDVCVQSLAQSIVSRPDAVETAENCTDDDCVSLRDCNVGAGLLDGERLDEELAVDPLLFPNKS